MGGVWRLPKSTAEAASARAAEDDQALRYQCLVCAFQTRDLVDVPHIKVVNVAADYYDFIRHGVSQCRTASEGTR